MLNQPINDAPWMAQGLCRQDDPELWMSNVQSDQRRAASICMGGAGHPPCPVRQICLAYAIERKEPHGVWGGFTERQRRRLAAGLPVDRRRKTAKV